MPAPPASQAGSPPSRVDPNSLNAYARQAITRGVVLPQGQKLGPAVLRTIPLAGPGTGSYVPASSPQVTITPQNVGLLIGFYLQVTLSISNGSAVAINLTDQGPANALGLVQFQDLFNNTRIQIPGWALAHSNSVRNHGLPFGAAIKASTGHDLPINWSANFAGVMAAPATIAASGNGTVTMWYWVPISYSREDLRGSIYINVINSTAQLILGFAGNGGQAGPNGVTVCAANGSDGTQAIYQGAAAGSVAAVTQTNATINCWQVFYDSLPIHPQMGLLLPPVDTATVYELKQTTLTAITANQDFPYQYPNYRDILSTIAVYINNPTGGVRGNGTDINYWQLLLANFTAHWKKSPALIAIETRNMIGTDELAGFYYFNTRQKPISTTQFGNTQLVLNASTVNPGAYMMVAIEDFSLQQALSIAGSLAAS